MNLTLKRNHFQPDGIFGELRDETGLVVAVTLEHAYLESPDGKWFPKIPLEGSFKCVRGKHRLHGMTEDFETFEVTGVEGHTNILLHWGNYNRDSEGCILVGEKVAEIGSGEMITNSRATFAKLMKAQEGVESFQLSIVV